MSVDGQDSAPVDRSSAPMAQALPDTAFPAFLRQRLTNGFEVIVARMPRVPLATLEIVLPAGAQWEPAEKHGLATLAAGMLDEGTARHDVHALARRVERTGSYLATSADWDAAYVQTGGLARHWQEGLSTLREVVLEPTFPPAEFERLRRQREAEILSRRDQPGAIADETFARAVFAGTPYDHSLSGDAAALEGLRVEDAAVFHREHRASAGAALVAAGDLDPEAVLRFAEAAFADWPAGEPIPPPAVAARPNDAVRIHLVDRPGAAQTELRVGHSGIARGDADRAILRVLNSLLGGKFTSRINLNLRERHGYTYGAFSRFVERRGAGPFVVSCAVTTANAGDAAREILRELERLREEPVPAAELADAQSYMLGVLPYSLQTADDIVDRLEDLSIHALPDDFFATTLRALRAVGTADILAAARRHLHPERATIVAVGPKAELAEQFAALGALVD